MNDWSPEPWPEIVMRYDSLSINRRDYNRARACVNACAGIADPAAIKRVIRDAGDLLFTANDILANRTGNHDPDKEEFPGETSLIVNAEYLGEALAALAGEKAEAAG